MDENNTNANPIADTSVGTNPQEPVVAPAQTPEAVETMPVPESTVVPETPVVDAPAEESAQA